MFPDADEIRISRFFDTMFALVGNEVSTEDGPGQWVDKRREGPDKEVDFEYLKETLVASGDTVQELWKSTLDYRRIEPMTQEEYLVEVFGEEIDDDLYKKFDEFDV